MDPRIPGMYISTEAYARPIFGSPANTTPSKMDRTEEKKESSIASKNINHTMQLTFDDTIDATKKGSLNEVESKLINNNLTLISELLGRELAGLTRVAREARKYGIEKLAETEHINQFILTEPRELTYDSAAKSANNQVLGSVTASINLNRFL